MIPENDFDIMDPVEQYNFLMFMDTIDHDAIQPLLLTLLDQLREHECLDEFTVRMSIKLSSGYYEDLLVDERVNAFLAVFSQPERFIARQNIYQLLK